LNERVLRCVYAAIDESNEDRQDRPPLEKSLDTAIHGNASAFDSLGLINFVVAVEEGVERDLGVPIMISDERALSQDPNPFETVGTLVAYIDVLLSEQVARDAAS
jgi:acyl carrier protein